MLTVVMLNVVMPSVVAPAAGYPKIESVNELQVEKEVSVFLS